MQNGVYPARYDRQFIGSLAGWRERVFTNDAGVPGLVVSQNGGGDFSVNISIGSAVIQGDDQPNQGMYLAMIDAVENLAVPSSPGGDPRIDLVCMRINDPQAGGPAGDNASFVVVQGTAAPAPVAPAVTGSAIPLAALARTSSESAILTAAITDVAPRGGFAIFGQVGTGAAPALMVPGDVYLRVS